MRSVKNTGIALLLALALCLAGCGYRSHYKSVLSVHTNTEKEASLSFYRFEGTYVMKLKLKDRSETALKYSASLGSGEMNVYYDYMGEKTPLCTVHGGETLEETGGYVEKGTVYVILESAGLCEEGSFTFAFAGDEQ